MKVSQLILLGEKIAVYSENHKEYKNTTCVCKMRGILTLKQVVHIVTTGLLKVK